MERGDSRHIRTVRLKRRARRGWRAVRYALWSVFLVGAVLGTGFLVFAFGLSDEPADRTTRTDAIVVLTGGAGRLDEGLRLLRRDMADVLLISGVNRQVTREEILRLAGDPPAPLAARITLGYRAERTRDNANETAAWFNSHNYRSLRLVTANYHMPRALLELRSALPRAQIIPHPVTPEAVSSGRWWRNRTGLIIVVKEYLKYLATWVLVQVT